MKKTLLINGFLKNFLLFVTIGLLAVSCSKNNLDTDLALSMDQLDCASCEVEQAFPDQLGITHSIPLKDNKTFTYEEINGQFVYGGDVLLTNKQIGLVREMSRNGENFRGVALLADRWPNGVVYYSIERGLANQQRVFDAMAAISASTNITFQEAVTKGNPRNRTPNYVRFRTGSGCSSYVGMIGGAQDINLATGCSTGNTIHEICHALGIFHEQSRIDRDNFVIINFNNIISGYENNFAKVSASYAADYTSTLDFGSIMMYPPTAFSSNGQPTITKLDGSLYSVQRNALSSDDIATISTMYP